MLLVTQVAKFFRQLSENYGFFIRALWHSAFAEIGASSQLLANELGVTSQPTTTVNKPNKNHTHTHTWRKKPSQSNGVDWSGLTAKESCCNSRKNQRIDQYWWLPIWQSNKIYTCKPHTQYQFVSVVLKWIVSTDTVPEMLFSWDFVFMGRPILIVHAWKCYTPIRTDTNSATEIYSFAIAFSIGSVVHRSVKCR